MSKIGPRWRVQFRRKREDRTDYRYRLRLLRSGKPRLVVRVSLKHVLAQVVHATSSGDLTLASAYSKELNELGWKGGTSNTSAAYLVGLLCGYRTLKAGVQRCVLDMGMRSQTPQAKMFAALKGALDAGLQVPHGDGILSNEERLRGEHIAKYAAKLKSKDEDAYRARFSTYFKRGISPEQLPEHFNQVKQAIITQYGG